MGGRSLGPESPRSLWRGGRLDSRRVGDGRFVDAGRFFNSMPSECLSGCRLLFLFLRIGDRTGVQQRFPMLGNPKVIFLQTISQTRPFDQIIETGNLLRRFLADEERSGSQWGCVWKWNEIMARNGGWWWKVQGFQSWQERFPLQLLLPYSAPA